MKQVLVKSGKVCVEEVPAPAVAPGFILVGVARSLISSGTETGFVSSSGAAGVAYKRARVPGNIEKVKRKIAAVGVKGTLDVIKSKLFESQAPGYSSAGVVLEVGEGVPGIAVGDRVACAGIGYASQAEYNLVPHQLVTPMPDGVDFDEAAFVALGGIAIQGVRRAEPTFGETVLVVGLGLIGQLTAQILRAAGCRVIGCDPVEAKRDLAASLGVECAVAPEELEDAVADWCGGFGADAAILCASSKGSAVTNQALHLCRPRARVSAVGAVGLDLERDPLYMKELDFRVSCSYGPGRYQPLYEEKGYDYPIGHVRWTEGRNMAEFLRLVAEGKVKVAPLVSLIEPVDTAPAAYAALLEPGRNAIAALISFGDKGAPPSTPDRKLRVRNEACSGDIGVAVIGAGGFAQAFHLPNLAEIVGVRIEAVVNQNGSRAKAAAERFGAKYCATDYREVLADKNVDAVLVCTRHHLHAEIAIAAAQVGKHIFVEKPLALTVEDCEAVVEAAHRAGVLLCTGFNRRFAPHALAARAAFAQTTAPKTLLYRCNAGPLPAEHWTRDPEQGGGRVLGEAVHFFDFCCWFLGGDPVAVLARRPKTQAADASEDDITAVMSFPDGSTATLLYTTGGAVELGKERIECYAAGGGIHIEDFRSLTIRGLPGEDQRGRREDKGHRVCLENFIAAVRGEAELAVTGEDGLHATLLAQQALASARQ